MEPVTNSKIKKTVLARARYIRAIRPVLSCTTFAVVVVAGSLYALGREVWVARVFENMPSLANVFAVLRFFESAFMNTTFVVQMISLLLVFGMVWIVRVVVRDTASTILGAVRFA